jgi:hypothetical protein
LWLNFDEKGLCDLALLYDISHHVNNLNTKLQGQYKVIFDMFGAVRAFEMKLKLFRKQLKNVNMCHFDFCDLLHKDGSASVPFPSVRAVEMIDSLAESFEMRFSAFRSHAVDIRIFENPFFVEVSDAPEKLQLELIELQQV